MASRDVFKREVVRMRDWANQHDGQFPPLLVSIIGRNNPYWILYFFLVTPKSHGNYFQIRKLTR